MRTVSGILAAGVFAALAAAAHAQANEPVRGVVRAVHDATISTELVARVSRIVRREGEPFAKGEPLIEFDCEKQKAELEAAEAEDDINRAGYDNAIELDRRKAIGKFDVRAAKSKWEKSHATVASIEAVVRDCRILAPFPGQVAEMRIHAHEMSSRGEPLLRIVDGDDLELDFIVPSNWLIWLKPGSALRARIDETGATHEAQVRRIAAAVDPVSQTVKITAVFAAKAAGVLPGMSVAAAFDAPGN